jgi:hypothetical protein
MKDQVTEGKEINSRGKIIMQLPDRIDLRVEVIPHVEATPTAFSELSSGDLRNPGCNP